MADGCEAETRSEKEIHPVPEASTCEIRLKIC